MGLEFTAELEDLENLEELAELLRESEEELEWAESRLEEAGKEEIREKIRRIRARILVLG